MPSQSPEQLLDYLSVRDGSLYQGWGCSPILAAF
jgi:hypothetical protein